MLVGRPRSLTAGGRHRVEADVHGVPLWFESRDMPIEPAPEAFGSALLLPCLERAVRLHSAAPLSDRWRAGVDELLPVLEGWWGLPRLAPDAPRGAAMAARPPAKATPTASFFSRGVDSFHTLLQLGLAVDALVFVPEFDLGMQEERHVVEAERNFRRIAFELGRRAVVIRTNLRSHPQCERMGWARAHGSALAAVGHVLGSRFEEVLISSSDQSNADLPWGTHSRVDHLWSSDRVEVRHVGASHWRREKLLAMLDEPIVQRELRVCFKPPLEGRSNCSRCEKCIRTMAILTSVRRLDDFACFSPPAPLAALIDTVPPLREGHVPVYRELERSGLPREESRAVRRLLLRSRLAPTRRRLTRALRRRRRGLRAHSRSVRRRLRRLRRAVRRVRGALPGHG